MPKNKNRRPSQSTVHAAFSDMPWMIMPSKMAEISAIVERYMMGVKLSESQIDEMIAASSFQSSSEKRMGETPVGIGVVPIVDSLMNRANFFSRMSGATSYQSIIAQLNEASANFDDIVLDIDSPGGAVNGVFQVVEAIHRIQGMDRMHSTSATGDKKRVYAVVNDMAASAAYLIAAHADQIIISPGSTTGSMGVMMVHMDVSGRDKDRKIKRTVIASGEDKAVGHDSSPLSKSDRDKLKAEVDKLHTIYVSSVSEGRGLELEHVESLATGKVFRGEEAIELGLADSTGSLTSTINQIIQEQTMPTGSTNKPKQTASADAPATTPQASAPEAVSNATLVQQLEALTGIVAGLAESQKATAEAAAAAEEVALTAKVEQLISGAIQSNKINLAQAEQYKADATENFELVSRLLGGMQSTAMPTTNPFGKPAQNSGFQASHASSIHPDAASVFEQFNLLGHDGNIDASRVTLPANSHGQVDYLNMGNAINMKDGAFQIRPEVKQAIQAGLSQLALN